MVRRITSLIRSYVVGGGITLGSSVPAVQAFITEFWDHRQNRMRSRLGPMCDELSRSGELFPVLHTNRVDGMSYVRFVPAVCIRDIETSPNDYEIETRYTQVGDVEHPTGRRWYGRGHRRAFTPTPRLQTQPTTPELLTS